MQSLHNTSVNLLKYIKFSLKINKIAKIFHLLLIKIKTLITLIIFIDIEINRCFRI